ncbi:hypothetical protein HWV62_14592 [Athelia sp. TMB]|nr:hypothetical protein HWV62_14592 [Athelia sp. TMB]
MPRPKPQARAPAAAAPAASKPRPKPPPEPTPADKVRREWAQFAGWAAAQRADALAARDAELQAAAAQAEVKQRGLPRGLHAALGRELAQTRRRITRTGERRLADRALAEWEARLERAGLALEDWDPMTPAEMAAVRAVLEGPSDDEDAGAPAVPEVLPHHSMSMQPVPAAPAPPVKPAVAIPDWSAEADRLRGLSPLPDVPDWSRPYTPHPAQHPAPTHLPPPPTPAHPPTPLRAATHAPAPAYTGPVLLDPPTAPSPLDADADFRAFALAAREHMIRAFHAEAAELELALVRHIHESQLDAEGVGALLAGHEVDVEELRARQEDARRAAVDAERTRRTAALRRAALQGGGGLHQPVARKAVEKAPFQKTSSAGWGSPPAVQMAGETPAAASPPVQKTSSADWGSPPVAQRPASRMGAEKPVRAPQKPEEKPASKPAGLWGSIWGAGEQPAKPPTPAPAPAPAETEMEMPGSLSLLEPPVAVSGKGAVARGKKAKAGRKGAPPPKEEALLPPAPPVPAPAPAPVQRVLGKDRARGAAKPMTPPKPTVEDASDEDDAQPWARAALKNEDDAAKPWTRAAQKSEDDAAKPWARSQPKNEDDAKPWARAEPKNEVDELAELFFKQASAAAAAPFAAADDDLRAPTCSTRPGKSSAEAKKAPVPQWDEASLDTPPSAAREVAPEDWGRSRSTSSGGESSASEQHAVWKPSAISLDSDEDEEDDDGDDGGFLSSLAGGLVEPEEFRPAAAAWGGGGAGGNPYAKSAPQGKYDSRWGGAPGRADVRLGQQRGPVVQDDWESQMMGKYLGGFAQGSGRY